MNHFVYKYVYNGAVIYVGLTDNIIRRVAEHASGQGLEAKFLPYLATNGGPIIAVAVENEYGSYGNDKKYLTAIAVNSALVTGASGLNVPSV